jgi:hypothetical protein
LLLPFQIANDFVAKTKGGKEDLLIIAPRRIPFRHRALIPEYFFA